MKVVIDANILFSALIKDSITRKLILEYDEQFIFPSYVFIEMEKHKDEILKKSKMSKKDFNELLRLLLQKIMIVPDEVLLHHQKEAYELIKDIDPDDELFIACALSQSTSILWSNDKRLKSQYKVKVLDTSEMIDYFKGQN